MTSTVPYLCAHLQPRDEFIQSLMGIIATTLHARAHHAIP